MPPVCATSTALSDNDGIAVSAAAEVAAFVRQNGAPQDRAPSTMPAALRDVTDEELADYFEAPAADEEPGAEADRNDTLDTGTASAPEVK